jgi:hypothetical protein
MGVMPVQASSPSTSHSHPNTAPRTVACAATASSLRRWEPMIKSRSWREAWRDMDCRQFGVRHPIWVILRGNLEGFGGDTKVLDTVPPPNQQPSRTTHPRLLKLGLRPPQPPLQLPDPPLQLLLGRRGALSQRLELVGVGLGLSLKLGLAAGGGLAQQRAVGLVLLVPLVNFLGG